MSQIHTPYGWISFNSANELRSKLKEVGATEEEIEFYVSKWREARRKRLGE